MYQLVQMNIESNKVSNLHQSPQLSGIVCYKHFLNRVHHSDFLNNQLPDKSVNLIIADFPYFEVKGEFDFIWASFDEFLAWVELCAKEFKRLLKDNGTLFVYGHAKKIAYKQIIFDKYFNLENNLCIEFNRQTKKGVENFRCFAPVSERCLMYSNEIQEELKNKYQSRLKELGFKASDFNKFMWNNGYCNNKSNIASHFFGNNKQVHAPSEWLNKKLCEFLNINEERRPFNNFMKLFDVMKFDQEAHITKNYDHETQKPETLTRALILTCSRENDLVLVPFAGSGTECAMAKKEKRNFIGFDINPVYVEMSNKRCDAIQSGLF
jgi:site-specific DNA-methyltransferase (adenine-specific)